MLQKRMQEFCFFLRLPSIILEMAGPNAYILGLYAARKEEFNREESQYE
jgi:hypothetical protein